MEGNTLLVLGVRGHWTDCLVGDRRTSTVTQITTGCSLQDGISEGTGLNFGAHVHEGATSFGGLACSFAGSCDSVEICLFLGISKLKTKGSSETSTDILFLWSQNKQTNITKSSLFGLSRSLSENPSLLFLPKFW